VVNSEKHEDVCKIRLKTMLTKGQDTWLNSKKNIPVQHLDIELKELMNYVPKSIDKEKLVGNG
jgi:hypothetical protein